MSSGRGVITLGLERTQGRHRECVLGLRHHVPGCRCRGHRDGDHRRGCRQRARVALDLAGCRRWPRGPCAAGRGVRDSASGGADQRAAAAGGTLLSSFGTFWAVEGLGVAWPGSDAAILVLVGWYVLAAAGYVGLLRRRARRLVPEETGA